MVLAMTHSKNRRDWYLHIELLERGKESSMALCILFCSINKGLTVSAT